MAGEEATGTRVIACACQTPPGARPNRRVSGPLIIPRVRSLEPASNRPAKMNDRRPQGHRTRLTGSLRHSTNSAARSLSGAPAAPEWHASLGRGRAACSARWPCHNRLRRNQEIREACQSGEAGSSGPYLWRESDLYPRWNSLDETPHAAEIVICFSPVTLQIGECCGHALIAGAVSL